VCSHCNACCTVQAKAKVESVGGAAPELLVRCKAMEVPYFYPVKDEVDGATNRRSATRKLICVSERPAYTKVIYAHKFSLKSAFYVTPPVFEEHLA
jgi:hypothetical protein